MSSLMMDWACAGNEIPEQADIASVDMHTWFEPTSAELGITQAICSTRQGADCQL